MGSDKALLEFDGRTLLERVIAGMSELFAEVLIAGGKPERYPGSAAPVVADRLEGRGAIIGLHAGLAAAKTPRIFAVACDAPFFSPELIRHLVGLAPAADWIVPRTGKGLEPLFAVYSQACRPVIEELVQRGQRQIIGLAERVAVHYVEEEELRCFDPELRSFINVNTPGDVRQHLDGSAEEKRRAAERRIFD